MTHYYRLRLRAWWGGDSPYYRKPCRVLCRGRNGNLLIEFEDGRRIVTTRWGVRRR